MCGIVGVWNRDGQEVDRTALRDAVRLLTHRGPDDEGYVLIDTRSGRAVACAGDDTRARGLPSLDNADGRFDLALGHRRLAIVDASPAGHQPMSSPDDRSWIAFNGMIYNFRELRADLQSLGCRFRSGTDTEVVLHAYERWGSACVERFNGMWSSILWDRQSRRLWVSRDRLGIKPLVYRVDDRRALFASEISALGPLGGLGDGIEPRAVHHYLSLMQVPAPYTIHRNVHKLRPARNLIVGVSSVEEDRYWKPVRSIGTTTDPDEACERLDQTLRDAVRLRLVADVAVGAFVSGGVDSGIVAALAASQQADRALPTFSIAVPWDQRIDESRWSNAIAAHLRSDHEQIDLRAEDFGGYLSMNELYGEPFAVSSVLGVYLVARTASSKVKVLLSGDGGDELFAGYAHRHFDIDERWDRFPRGALGRMRAERALAAGQWVRWRGKTRSTMRRLRLRSFVTSERDGRDHQVMHRRCMFNDVEKHALYAPAWRSAAAEEDTIPWLRSMILDVGDDRILRRQLHDVETMLHDEMTAKLDRGTMAWGLEGRVPLLDHNVVELALSLPPAHRYAEGEGKWLLRRVAARHLPAEILTRPKRGFTVPITSWLRAELHDFVHDTLSTDAIRRAGIFAPEVVDDVIAHYERDPDYHRAHMVFTLLCFQLWFDRRHEASA